MRAAIIHMLVALLIAVFAIGAPQSVRADCLACQDCTVSAPAKDHAPCSQGALDCQVAQSCGGQLQKMPGQSTIGIARTSTDAAFGEGGAVAVKSAATPPETTPPRL
jgi:hypothetical protein